MVFSKQRKRNVKTISEFLNWKASFGYDGLSHIKFEFINIIRPCARVLVEDDVVLSVVPVRKTLKFVLDVKVIRTADILVECVYGGDEHAGFRRIRRIVPWFFKASEYLPITAGNRELSGVHVHLKPSCTPRKVETSFHATLGVPLSLLMMKLLLLLLLLLVVGRRCHRRCRW